MDLKIEVKEEPVWLEGTAGPSFDNYKIVSEKARLEEKPKLELVEPGQTQPFADIKDEISVEERPLVQLVPCLKEDNEGNNAVFTRVLVDTCHNCCKVLKTGSDPLCHLPPDTGAHLSRCNVCNQLTHSRQGAFHHNTHKCSVSVNCNEERKILFPEGEKTKCFSEVGDTFTQTLDCQQQQPLNSDKQATQSKDGQHNCNEDIKSPHLNSKTIRGMLKHSPVKLHCCHECGNAFSSNWKLKNHMITHTGEKPYFCGECGIKFQNKVNLKHHVLTHTGHRPYNCDYCGKKFAVKSTLNFHILTHTGERPFSCNECGKTFLQRSNLRAHLVTHSNEKPHCCDVCGRQFNLKSSLKRHVLTHSQERPFCCNECGWTFVRKHQIRKHLVTHTLK